jgi:hypothetical protein
MTRDQFRFHKLPSLESPLPRSYVEGGIER